MDVHVRRTVPITYEMVARAYQKVKQGGKAAGVDGESWKTFEEKGVEKQLYIIWNRLASGSYYPQAVREVEIPKKNGKKRKLGIPTLRDRIAQEVVKRYMEVKVDQQFHENSYGYRPLKSSADALEQVRRNCKEKDWVVDLDISKFFDEIDHELMIKAVEAIHEERWIRVYVKRWLEMKIQRADGSLYDREGKGTPQGGVISPLLANLFLHFGLDLWLTKHHPSISFVRYADDIVLHCATKDEAEFILTAIKERLGQIKLQLNEEKSGIVYCQDWRRKENHEKVRFGFLGYSFQPRRAGNPETRTSYTAFNPEISLDNQVKIRSTIRETVHWWVTTQSLEAIATKLNPKIRGWINYFGRFGKTQLRKTLAYLNGKLALWLSRKHKCGRRSAWSILRNIFFQKRQLFYHWQTPYCAW